MSQQAVIWEITTSVTTEKKSTEQPLHISLSPATERRLLYRASKSVIGSNVDQKSTKSITTKFERILQLVGIHPSTKEPFHAVPTSRVIYEVYDGSKAEQTTKENGSSPFALNLTPEISMDESELDYIRRTQTEECLEYQKRMLFAK